MDFSSYFADILKSRGISQNKAGPMLGVSGPFVNQLVKGTRLPPLDQISRWATVLHLEGSERDRLMTLAHLAHTPDPVCLILQDLEAQIAKTRGEKDALQTLARTMERTLLTFQTQISELSSDLVSMKEENRELEAKVEELTAELEVAYGRRPGDDGYR